MGRKKKFNYRRVDYRYKKEYLEKGKGRVFRKNAPIIRIFFQITDFIFKFHLSSMKLAKLNFVDYLHSHRKKHIEQ